MDDEAVAADLIANAVSDFLDELEAGRPEYAYFMAARAIQLIEMFEQNPTMAAIGELLIRAEIVRQNYVLAQLESGESSGPDLLADESRIAGSVFGAQWFKSVPSTL